MSDLLKVALTAALTIFGGLVLFVVNQWVQKFFFEPMHEQARVIGQIDFALTYWAWAYANPTKQISEDRDRASNELRECASRLLATTNAIRGYRVAAWLGSPIQLNVKEASDYLIGLSNSIYSGEGRLNSEDAKKIRALLCMRVKAGG